MKWTEEKLAELQVLFDEGLTLLDIADRMGETGNAVRNIVKKKGMKRPRLVRSRVERDMVNRRVHQAIAALVESDIDLTSSACMVRGTVTVSNERLAEVAGVPYKTEKMSCVLNDLRDDGLIEVEYGDPRTITLLRGPDRVAATIVRESLRVDRPDHAVKTRKCLSCGDEFRSEWRGNRVCEQCKGTDIWTAGYENSGYVCAGL